MGEAATAASDRYALAVVAFELLTGEKPVRGRALRRPGASPVEDDPPRGLGAATPSSPSAVDDVIDRGMAKDPDDRWSTAEEFVERLGESLTPPPRRKPAPATTATRPLASRDRTPPPSRPARPVAAAERPGSSGPGTGVLLAALAAALLVVVLGFLLLKGNGDDKGNQASKTRTPTATATRRRRRRRRARRPRPRRPRPRRPPRRRRRRRSRSPRPRPPAAARASSRSRRTTSTTPASTTRRCRSPSRRS